MGKTWVRGHYRNTPGSGHPRKKKTSLISAILGVALILLFIHLCSCSTSSKKIMPTPTPTAEVIMTEAAETN